MSTQTLVRIGTLPIVNLLPPEFGEAQRLRKLQMGLGAGVLVSVGVVAALVFGAAGQASDARSDLDSTKAEGVSLQVQTTKYANVPAVIAKVDAAELQRSSAMSQEIRWSSYLNDLSLQIPAGMWLTNVAATQSSVDAAAAVPLPGVAPAYPDPGIGTVTLDGQAYRHNDVATWLEALAHERGWTQAYFTNSAEDPLLVGPGGDPVVKFTSQVTVTSDALSRRFDQKAGS
jgi:Tfp pilus assembly protein PilN